MLNYVSVMGRLCADPELRRTGNDVAVTSMRLAVTRDFVTKGQERETDFFDVVAWRATAEFAAKHLSKGRMIVVKGSLQNREWTDKNGVRRTSTEIVAENIYFADSRNKESAAPGTSGAGFEYSQLPAYDEADPDPIMDDEIPF